MVIGGRNCGIGDHDALLPSELPNGRSSASQRAAPAVVIHVRDAEMPNAQ